MASLQKRRINSNCRQKPWGSNCSPKWLRTETLFFCRSLTANAKLAKSTSQQLVLSRQKSWQEFASLAKTLITLRLIIRYTHRWESILAVAVRIFLCSVCSWYTISRFLQLERVFSQLVTSTLRFRADPFPVQMHVNSLFWTTFGEFCLCWKCFLGNDSFAA